MQFRKMLLRLNVSNARPLAGGKCNDLIVSNSLIGSPGLKAGQNVVSQLP